MAIDIVARGLASSLIGANGRVDAAKMPQVSLPSGEGVTFTPVGALTDESWIQGRTAEEIILAILYGKVNPILTEPSFSLELDQDYVIADVEQEITGVMHFDRGLICAPGGPTQPRTGSPKFYEVGSGAIATTATEVPFSILFTAELGENEISALVHFEEGEQPVDNLGAPYGEPYAAGTLASRAYLTGVAAITNSDDEAIEFTYFEESDGDGYQVIATAESATSKQSFKIASTSPIVGIKQFNVLTQKWEWIGGSAAASLATFDTTLITDESSNTTYLVYTHNGSLKGARELRLYTTIEE